MSDPHITIGVVPEGTPLYGEDGELVGGFPSPAMVVVENDQVVQIESVPTVGQG